MLLILLAVVILLPFIASFIRSPIFLARRMIFASIPFYLLAGWAFSVLPSKKIKVIFTVLFFLFSFFALAQYYKRPFKEQWRETAQFIDQKAKPGDLLLFHTAFPQLGFDFYSKRPDIERRGFPEPKNTEVIEIGPDGKQDLNISLAEAMKNGTGRIWQIISLEGNTSLAANKINELESMIAGRSRVWLVLSFARDPQNAILNKLREKFPLVTSHQFRGIDVYLFERKPSV